MTWRNWMRLLVTEANVAHELHVLDCPDEVCKQRLARHNVDGSHPFQIDDETFEQSTSYFVPRSPEKGFNVILDTE